MCYWQVTITLACQWIVITFIYNPHLSYSPFYGSISFDIFFSWTFIFSAISLLLDLSFSFHKSYFLHLSWTVLWKKSMLFYIFFPSILSVIASYSFYHFLSDDTILQFTYSRMSHPLYKFLREPFALNLVSYILFNETSIEIQHGSNFFNIGHRQLSSCNAFIPKYILIYLKTLKSLVTKCLSVC